MEQRVHLISFCDGSYKKLVPVDWTHSQWIHYTTNTGHVVRINPANVNYIEEFPTAATKA